MENSRIYYKRPRFKNLQAYFGACNKNVKSRKYSITQATSNKKI